MVQKKYNMNKKPFKIWYVFPHICQKEHDVWFKKFVCLSYLWFYISRLHIATPQSMSRILVRRLIYKKKMMEISIPSSYMYIPFGIYITYYNAIYRLINIVRRSFTCSSTFDVSFISCMWVFFSFDTTVWRRLEFINLIIYYLLNTCPQFVMGTNICLTNICRASVHNGDTFDSQTRHFASSYIQKWSLCTYTM